MSGHAEVPAIWRVAERVALCPGREQRGGEHGQHRQVHMEPDPLDAPYPQRQHGHSCLSLPNSRSTACSQISACAPQQAIVEAMIKESCGHARKEAGRSDR